MDLSDIFKKLIWDSIIKALLDKLFLAIPFLGWGPVGIIVALIVNKLGSWIFDAMKMFIDFSLIVIKKEELAREYAVESLNLKNIALSKGIDSEEFKAERIKAAASLSRFVKFGA